MAERVVVPPEIQIGSHRYKILFNPALVDTREYGAVNYRTQEIEINPTRPASQKAEALIHEILHVVDRVFCNEKIEEGLTSGLSEGLAQAVQGLGVEFDWGLIQERDG